MPPAPEKDARWECKDVVTVAEAMQGGRDNEAWKEKIGGARVKRVSTADERQERAADATITSKRRCC